MAWPQTCWPPASTVEARVVTWTIQRAVAFVVGERKTLVWAGRGKADNVAIWSYASRHPRSKLYQHSWCLIIGIRNR